MVTWLNYDFDLMFQIAHKPSIYVLDTPGVLVPSISDIETGLKLALAGTNVPGMTELDVLCLWHILSFFKPSISFL